MIRRLALAATLACALLSSACLGDTTSPTTSTTRADPATETYAANLAVNVAEFTKSASGLYVKEVAVGTGAVAAKATDSVAVSYRGFFSNGSAFDSTSTGAPVAFRLSGVISGFAEGVTGMRAGGRRRLLIPPELGYGLNDVYDANGRLRFPGNKVLVFDVALTSVY